MERLLLISKQVEWVAHEASSRPRSLRSVSSQGYDDGYGGEYDDESYDAYEDDYSNQSKRCCLHSHATAA